VRREDRNFLGILCKQKYYIDTCLPFSLRSAPCLFNHLATVIHWILENNYGVQHILYYLDDFLTVGPANTEICQQNLTNMLSLYHKINVPVKG